MRTHVEFRSPSFPAQPGEDEQINPGRFGKALAEFLCRELAARGVAVGEPHAEDFGWAFSVVHTEFPVWIACGNDEVNEDGFVCFIEPSQPTVGKFLKKIDTTVAVERVAAALDASLRANPSIRDIRWWSDEESGRSP